MERTTDVNQIIVNITAGKNEISVCVVPEQLIGACMNEWAESLDLATDSEDNRVWELTTIEGVVLPKFEEFSAVCSGNWLDLLMVEHEEARTASGLGEPAPVIGTAQMPRPVSPDLYLAADDRLDKAISATKPFLPPRPGRCPRMAALVSMVKPAPAALQRAVPTRAEDLSVADLTVQRRPTRVERYRAARQKGDYATRLAHTTAWGRMAEPGVVACVSSKGGVGKTTIAELLASRLADTRQERVLVIDCNPDYGTLGYALTPDAKWFVDDMAELFAAGTPKWIDVEARLSHGPNGLLVLPAPRTADRMAVLTAEHYSTVINGLSAFVNAIVCDCGTGMFDPTTVAALKAASQLVVVSDAEPSSARPVAQALTDVLDGFQKPTTLVVNRWQERGARLDLGRLTAHIQARADVALTLVAECREGAEALNGASFDWEVAPKSWVVEVGELAAVVVGRWRDMGVVREH